MGIRLLSGRDTTSSLGLLAATVLLASVTVLSVLGGAAAQPTASFSLTADGPVVLTPMATTAFTGNITLSCIEITEQRGEAIVALGAVDPPSAINVTGDDVVFAISDCPGGSGSVTKSALFSVTDTGTAAFSTFDLTLTATLGGHNASTTLEKRSVGYAPGQTMDPEGDLMIEVEGATHGFPLTLEIQANGDTMVMFEDKTVTGTGSLTGLRATTFDVDGGHIQEILNIEFRAPEGAWTEETVTFRTYSHCLEGGDCGPINERTITWTFLNVNQANMTDTGLDDEAAPDTAEANGLGLAAFLGLGLGGLAHARRNAGGRRLSPAGQRHARSRLRP